MAKLLWLSASAQAASEPPRFGGSRASFTHDPSTIVVCRGEYWVFSTGRGVFSQRSKDLASWERGPTVFSASPSWTFDAVPGHDGRFWAPDVIQVSNRYLLYYSVSTWGKRTSAIGLATTRSLDPSDPACRWTDHGPVIQSSERNDFNAIDPSVLHDRDGSLWLAFGSFWSGIKLIQLDPKTGMRMATNSPLHSLAWHGSIEAPYLYQRGSHYYLFVNWGLCCRGVESTYEIRVGRSDRVTGPYRDRDGVDMLRGGGTPVLGTSGPFIGPGHAGVISCGGTNWLSCHYYDGARRGMARLSLQRMDWDAEGWPTVRRP